MSGLLTDDCYDESDGLLTKKGANYDVESGSYLSNSQISAMTAMSSAIARRMAFVRKVYLILMAQVAATLACIVAMSSDSGYRFVQENSWLLWTSIAVSLVSFIALMCFGNVRKSFPANYILLAIFTAAEGYMIGAVSSMYTTESVFQAVVITAAIFVGLTLYTMQSKRDFSGMGPFLFSAIMVLLVGGFLRYFLPSSPFMDTVWACLGALIFALFIIYDTYILLNKMPHDEYMLAALSLYLDIINLFLKILRLFGNRRN